MRGSLAIAFKLTGMPSPGNLPLSEWNLDPHPGRSKMVDIAGDNACLARKGRRGDQQVGAAMTKLRRKPAPDPRGIGVEGQDAVGKGADRQVQPAAQIGCKAGVDRLLTGNATLDLAQGYDREI